jgi:Mediator of RNA polymerase II transcription subunit 1
LIPNFDVISNSFGMDRNSSFNRSMMSKGKTTTSALGRGTEEERLKKLKVIVEKLRTVLPRLSTEGLEIIGQRAGLDTTLEPLHAFRADGSRDLYLAGRITNLEVNFKREAVIDKAVLMVGGESQNDVSTVKFAESASEVFQYNLTHDTKKLDKFNANVLQLAKLDRLSGAEGKGFHAFGAMVGVYDCLKKIHDYEMKKTLPEVKSEAHALQHVLRSKSGFPRMNARHTLGLTIDFWTEGRIVNEELDDSHTYSLSIECESCLPNEFPHARVSSEWISDEIETTNGIDINGMAASGLAWLDPPFPDTEMLSIPIKKEDGAPTVKNTAARFVAKLNPPLVVPLAVAQAIRSAVGLKDDIHPTDFDQVKLYHNLLLGTELPDGWDGSDLQIFSHRTFPGRTNKQDSKSSSQLKHINCLYHQIILGYVLDELPFSHPKQLLEIIPVSCCDTIHCISLTLFRH